VLVRLMLRWGFARRHTYLLNVPGRKSGRLYSTPVTLGEEGRFRWLVTPYGEVGWVRNARAAAAVTVSRSRRAETVGIRKLTPSEAAPVLKTYLTQVPITRPFFDVTPESDLQGVRAKRGGILAPCFVVCPACRVPPNCAEVRGTRPRSKIRYKYLSTLSFYRNQELWKVTLLTFVNICISGLYRECNLVIDIHPARC